MKHIGTYTLSLTLFVAAALAFGTPTGGPKVPLDGNGPLALDVNPNPVEAGSEPTFTLILGSAALNNQTYTISTNSPSSFDYLPSTVTILQGQSYVTFNGNVASTASGSVTVSATRSGTTRSVTFTIQ